jgi:hypothetical protein
MQSIENSIDVTNSGFATSRSPKGGPSESKIVFEKTRLPTDRIIENTTPSPRTDF